MTGSGAAPAAPAHVWSSITAAAITKSAGSLRFALVAIRECIAIGGFGVGSRKFYLNCGGRGIPANRFSSNFHLGSDLV